LTEHSVAKCVFKNIICGEIKRKLSFAMPRLR